MYASGICENSIHMEYIIAMTSDEYDKLINDLAEWCKPRGRRVELADALGVTRQQVTNILAKRRMLSFEQAIAIKKIIRHRRRK
jgi:hypothetical protein